ncbi:MAG: LacI family DNA-binding transcriptional regulator [Geminicoccaceae bacterium]
MRATRQGRIGLREVAQHLGVSPVTVSNAFNRPDQLSAALRARVLAAAAELGYAGPQPAARMLRTGRAGAIALYTHDPITHLLRDAHAITFLQGVAAACQERQMGLLLLPGAVSGGADLRAIEAAAVDGFLLYALAADQPGVARVLARRLPVVAVDVGAVAGIATVGIDDRAAAAMAGQHVLALGHRRLAVLSLELLPDGHDGRAGPERLAAASFAVTRARWQGLAEAMAAHGLDAAAVPVLEIAGNSRATAARLVAGLLWEEPGRRPTALLAMSDELALGALDAARALGLAVPGELAITGFDDTEAAAAAGLTTVRQPAAAKGRVAVEALLAAEPSEEGLLLPTELVVRRSTSG